MLINDKFVDCSDMDQEMLIITLVRILPGYQDTSGVHSYARTDLVMCHLTSDLVSFEVQAGHSRTK